MRQRGKFHTGARANAVHTHTQGQTTHISHDEFFLVIDAGNSSFALRHKVELCDVIAKKQFVCSWWRFSQIEIAKIDQNNKKNSL